MSRSRVTGLLLLALALGGCAGFRVPGITLPPWAKTDEPPTATAAKAAAMRAKAEELERQGALREALAAWQNALGLEPGHAPTQQAIARVRARIDREVADHLERGRRAATEARRHYAAALALDPDSRPAQEALRAAPVVARPNDVSPRPPGPDEKPEALYAMATAHLAEGRDLEAHRALVQLARVNPPYKNAPTLLRDVRARLVRQHYQEGLRLFREEKIEAAIGEWRIVLEVDPKHASARRNIEQGERMLRTLTEDQKR